MNKVHIINEVKLVFTVLPHNIIFDNIAEYLRDLITINDLLIVQYKADLIQYKNAQIKDFMQNRYRVIVTENDKKILKTASDCIKKKVNTHFQNIASSFNHEKLISGIWVDQYSPKADININIYDRFMDHIT
ncbi:hypothetical protein C1646_758830 [Rhizophagus diaphanus]|nr:hypothetical protein C1646_758830 [Rhizophagus diaphanus] [Rhizophagus sp. MUCL 43196]